MIKTVFIAVLLLFPLISVAGEPGYYNARLIRVLDGDTFEAEIDLGLNIRITEIVRVLDYDAPETWRPKSEQERIRGEAATDSAIELLQPGFVLRATYGRGSFGRVLVDVRLPDGRDYVEVMKNLGHVKEQ